MNEAENRAKKPKNLDASQARTAARLSEALRDNLHRRKAQARLRAAEAQEKAKLSLNADKDKK